MHYICAYLWDSWTVHNDVYSDHTEHSGFAPYGVFIVSKYPFHNSFARILDNFMSIRDKSVISSDHFVETVHQMLSRSFHRMEPVTALDDDTVNEEVITIECPNGDMVQFENNGHFMPMADTATISYYTPSLRPDVNWV